MITSITLQGFKSFADRTRLEFGPGITAVIGPNGSGKSNVVEALRWVSHQARARELRAARATELIFHGSSGDGSGQTRSGKAPLGLAEVQLELRTHAGERLHLSRRIYRDGTAEQDIMGRTARARDVQGSLRGTGLGSGGLAVIGQGEVGSVVQAEGRTLLAYVQEAAGLSRTVAARQETAEQLGGAEAHLAQVRLLEDELGTRVRRLEHAAGAAERHRVLSLQLLHWQDALVRAKHLAALDDLLAVRQRVRELETEAARTFQDVQRAAAELEQARDGVSRAREQQQAHAQALDLFLAAQRAQAQAEESLLHLDRDLQAVRADLEQVDTGPPADPAPDLAALEAGLAQVVAAQTAASREARTLESALKQAREQAGRSAWQEAARESQRQTLEAEAAHLAAQLAQDAAAHEATISEGQRLMELAATLTRSHEAAVAEHAELLEREREARSVLQRTRAELPPLRREQERLESSLNGYARYGEGPRNALRSDHAGIVGSVADLLRVPAEHETAVGAALGRRLEQVVVQTADDAREIIELLKRSGGRATFLPLELLRLRPRRDAALLHEPGVLGNLSDLCPSDPPIVGQNLLSDTLLLSSLQAATSLARRHSSRPRLVTVDGELLEPGGALTGGRLRDSGVAVLSDQRRFQELEEELVALEARQKASLATLSMLAGDLEESSIRESVARAARDQTRAREREAALQLAGLEARRSSLETQLRALTSRMEDADAHVEGPAAVTVTDQAPVRLEAELDALRAGIEDRAQLERDAAARLAEARSLALAWTAHRAALVRIAELTERHRSLLERRDPFPSWLAGLQAETARLQGLLGDLDPQALAQAEARREAASQLYSTLIGRQNRTTAALEETRLTVARREGSLISVPDGACPSGTPREWQAQLTAGQRELEALGAVNPAAAQDLQDERERLALLSAQRQDVESAAGELRSHLTELDRTEQRATELALERVGRAFSEYSGELLGGLGELEQDRDEDARVVGLRLAVQPRGKRTRSLTLLSAGERTMAGLAFLFALGHAPEDAAAGLPLSVLDEVDAPLDEANIRRFTRFLTLFAERGSQFLLVTHQKATMEVAAALWGVTTDATGASRVLSIRQAEDKHALPFQK